jgi:hypothetical protein
VAAPLTVKRARVSGTSASRKHVEHWLASVAVDRLGLAADEILYVPRLRMRVPAHAEAGGSRIPDQILEALRAELAGADSGWGEGFVPGRAYRFTSRGRYFAWLVALLVKNGSAPARAAFVAATGEESLRQWQRAAVLGDGTAFVATVARLAESGCVARWVARFEPADIALVRQALEHSFAIPLETALAQLVRRRPPEAQPQPVVPMPVPPALREAIASLEASGNDWRALPAPGKALLLAAVVLARNPSRSTTQAAELAAAIARFSDPAEAQFADTEWPLQEPRPAGRKATGPAPPIPPARGIGARLTERRTRSRTFSVPSAPASKGATSRPSHGEPVIQAGQIPATPAPDAQARSEPAPSMAVSPPPTTVRREQITPFLPPDARFETGFGGLLFLLNAFIALDLYPDFTQPLGTRLDPSPLWLADRIGRFWFGAKYRRDPLAAWIAAHAASGELPSTWRAEPEWLIGFEIPGAPRLALRQGRATLWHPAGFPLSDEAQARASHRPRRLAGFRRPGIARIAPARLPAKLADRWAACLAFYLDARLRRLCGSGLSLLALPARIQTRDLDLSARFALDHHPIQLRIAGLDRNPGWQPAEGRAIAFMFE